MALLIIVIDQASKLWVNSNLVPGKVYSVLPHFNFYLTYNRGVAFSMFSSSSVVVHNMLFILSLLIVFGLVFLHFKLDKSKYLLHFALALVIGGAIGNMVDKVILGFVIDFIDFYWGSWHFATFNLADAAISVGGFFIILDSFLNERKVTN